MKRCPENREPMYYARIIAKDYESAKEICELIPLVSEMGLIKLDSFSDEQTLI